MRNRLPILAMVLTVAGASARGDSPATVAVAASVPAASSSPATADRSPLADAIRVPDANARRAALARMEAACEIFCEVLLGRAEDPDPEVVSRAADALEEMPSNTAIARTLVGMPKPLREKFAAFRKDHGELVAQAYSRENAHQLQAVAGIAALDDPRRTAEPLVAVLLASPYPEAAVAAAELAKTGKYRSDETVDALLRLYLAPVRAAVMVNPMEAKAIASIPYPPKTALEALTAIRSPHAAPTLLAVMQRQYFFMTDTDLPVPEALAATGELRAIPTLLKRLDAKQVLYADHAGKESIARCDIALWVLVKLTGGNLEEYGFVDLPGYKGQLPAMAFTDDDARKAAIAKFRAWWEANKDKAPCKDLKPLAIPPLPAQR